MRATWIARRVERWLSEIPAGRVHSRFDSVLNLAWGGHLITLARPEAGRLPGGILIDPATVEPGSWPGAQGDPVSWDPAAQVLRLPGGQVALGAAVREREEPAPLAQIEPDRVKQNLQTLDRLARISGKGELVPLLGACLDPFHAARADEEIPTAWHELRLLAGALAEGDGPALAAAARPMLGRGQGLTPAWDDLLLGFMAIAWFVEPALPRPTQRALHALMGALAQAAPQRTTAISANYLILAADGGWSERLSAATLALLTATGPSLVAPLQRLLAFGHSSGHDTAVGLTLGGATILHLIEPVGGNKG